LVVPAAVLGIALAAQRVAAPQVVGAVTLEVLRVVLCGVIHNLPFLLLLLLLLLRLGGACVAYAVRTVTVNLAGNRRSTSWPASTAGVFTRRKFPVVASPPTPPSAARRPLFYALPRRWLHT
jgi:hypothetical protein